MDVSTIISLSRKQTGTTAGQISDNDYLVYLNIIYKDLFSRLSVNSKKYTWQSFTTPVIVGQSEYVLPQPGEDETGIKLVLKGYLDGKGIPLYDTSLYDNRKEITDPKWNTQPYGILRDGSIFIIPIPEKAGELRIEGKYIPLDLALTNTSDEIKLAPEYHNILVKGLNSLIFGEKQVFDKQQLREGTYLQGVQQIQTEGSFEMESAYHVEGPYLGFLE